MCKSIAVIQLMLPLVRHVVFTKGNSKLRYKRRVMINSLGFLRFFIQIKDCCCYYAEVRSCQWSFTGNAHRFAYRALWIFLEGKIAVGLYFPVRRGFTNFPFTSCEIRSFTMFWKTSLRGSPGWWNFRKYLLRIRNHRNPMNRYDACFLFGTRACAKRSTRKWLDFHENERAGDIHFRTNSFAKDPFWHRGKSQLGIGLSL